MTYTAYRIASFPDDHERRLRGGVASTAIVRGAVWGDISRDLARRTGPSASAVASRRETVADRARCRSVGNGCTAS